MALELRASGSNAPREWTQFGAFRKDVINAILGRTNSSALLSDDGVLRKVAHATEFAVLGTLLMLLMTGKVRERLRSLVLCGLATAFFDETIQLFVIGRSSKIMDVWIDLLGYSVGLLISALVLLLTQWRKKTM